MGFHNRHDDRVLSKVEHSLAVVVGYVANAVGRDAAQVGRMHTLVQGFLQRGGHTLLILGHIGRGIKGGVAAVPAQVMTQH